MYSKVKTIQTRCFNLCSLLIAQVVSHVFPNPTRESYCSRQSDSGPGETAGGAAGFVGSGKVSFASVLDFGYCLRFLAGGFFLLFLSNLQAQSLTSLAQEFFEQVTTITEVQWKTKQGFTSAQGTAFFYADTEDEAPQKNRFYVVSNRHVFYPEEQFPEKIIIYIRVSKGNEKPPQWSPLEIPKAYLIEKLKVFKNKNIDVAAIEITEFIGSLTVEQSKNVLVKFIQSSQSAENYDYQPTFGEQVLTIGYPKGFFDEYNKTPIIKSGIIASSYGRFFGNLPCYVIDTKLYHGSSGSLVVTPARGTIETQGEIRQYTKPVIMALGIFSGEPYQQKKIPDPEDPLKTVEVNETFDLGVVWYFDLIEKLIKESH